MSQPTPMAEQRRIVELWRTSGVPKTVFARRHGIRKATFFAWVDRHPLEAHALPTPPNFVQLSAQAPPPAGFFTRVGPYDLRFAAPLPVSWFAAVVRELSAC